MIRRPPRSTRTDTLFPYPTLFRSAWYPGQEGAAAIADVLTGKVNPSGRLPITFPAATDTLPRPAIPSYGTPETTQVTVRMNEGSDVGYRWNARTGLKAPLPFGHGLSSTPFTAAPPVAHGPTR